ncbi:MAG TPA: hypothetical protein PKE16_05115 [Hyphomicrobium sp.]|nr:hypothetical protein [Hyphomicrobium sp.]
MSSWNSVLRAFPRSGLFSIIAFAAVLPSSGSAFALSLRVQIACAADYYAHCSAFSPTSPQVRSCMRAVGNSLSKRCVDALVSAGEVSANEVARRRAISDTSAR